LKPLFDKQDDRLASEAIRQYFQLLEGKPAPTYTKVSSPPASKAEAQKARVKVGLSQSRFALALGISPMTVQSWERGVRRPGGLESKILRLLCNDPAFIANLMRV
jgi:putative transcriptional regulator